MYYVPGGAVVAVHVLMLSAIIVVLGTPNLGCGTFCSSTTTKTAVILRQDCFIMHADRSIDF